MGKGTGEQETELAFRIADRYISIQKAEEGYDYSIVDVDYRVVDGGVYSNRSDEDGLDVSIREALMDIVDDLKGSPDYNGAKGNIQKGDELIPVDYDKLMEKVEEAERINLQDKQEIFDLLSIDIKTNIGKIPVPDYLEMKAYEYGYDCYKDLYEDGRRIAGYEKVSPEFIEEWCQNKEKKRSSLKERLAEKQAEVRKDNNKVFHADALIL